MLSYYYSITFHCNIYPVREDVGSLKRHTRILVQKGVETIALKLEDVVLFYTQNRVVFVLDKDDRKYMYDKSLAELEEELDPREFFRVNRQYILHIDAIKSFKPYERGKLQIRLSLENTAHTIIVSQHTAPAFKRWISRHSIRPAVLHQMIDGRWSLTDDRRKSGRCLTSHVSRIFALTAAGITIMYSRRALIY